MFSISGDKPGLERKKRMWGLPLAWLWVASIICLAFGRMAELILSLSTSFC